MGNFTLEHLKLIISGIISKFPRPDWKQDDPMHPNYINNRTHYDFIRYETLEFNVSAGGLINKKNYDLVDEKVYKALCSYDTEEISNILVDGLPITFVRVTSYEISYKIDNYRYLSVAPDYKNKVYVLDTRCPDTSPSNPSVVKLKYTYAVEDAKKLDEKYIPDNIPKIDKAKKGQFLTVKEVDKKGKPTDWEAADMTQVQADYAQTDSSKPDYILNKPTNLVKNTDYATSSKAGLVRTNTSYGTQMSGQYIMTYPATSSEVTSKSNNYKPITPKTVDYAVKAGLGNSSLTWSETEKTKARNVIDAASKSDLSNVQSSLNNIQNNLNNIESGKQSDWEQGDFDSPDFVKNRTHYDCNIKKVIKYNINYGGNLFDWTNKTNFSVIDESLHQQLLNTTINSTGITLDGVNIDTPTHSWQYDIVTIKVTSYISLFVHLYYPLVYALNIDSPAGIQSTIELVWNYEKWELKQLDEKYIPDTIQRVSDTVKALENVAYIEIEDTIIFPDSGNFIMNDDGNGNITITSNKIEVGNIDHDVTITSSILSVIDNENGDITIVEQ